jgi:ankyrin repeat protein
MHYKTVFAMSCIAGSIFTQNYSMKRLAVEKSQKAIQGMPAHEIQQPDLLVTAIKKNLESAICIEEVSNLLKDHLKLMNIPLQDIRNVYNCTTLHFAASLGEKDVAQVILEIDKNLLYETDKNGNTVLHKAVWFEQIEMIKFLIKSINKEKALSFIEQKNNRGKTALEIVEGPKSIQVTQLLEDIKKELKSYLQSN